MEKHKILMLTSYPPRECGIATFARDLAAAIQKSFGTSLEIEVCALENGCDLGRNYPTEVTYTLNSNELDSFFSVADKLNERNDIGMVCIQHEFGLYGGEYGSHLIAFLLRLNIPVCCIFHTVLPHPDEKRLKVVQALENLSEKLIVLTQKSADILIGDYEVNHRKISVIPHGTHIVLWKRKQELKEKYGFKEKRVLSTFGLLSENKNIETALRALPEVLKHFPDTVYLILGKTHPEVVKKEGEKYRGQLEKLVEELGIAKAVIFVNEYLPLPTLLEYLTFTDIYLFTSKDPNQAVSGTFAYAMSCGSPVISTPIPHAKECLDPATGILLKDFGNPKEISEALLNLLAQPMVGVKMGRNAFSKMRASSWENVAIAYSQLFQEYLRYDSPLEFQLPPIKTNHLEDMTTDFGMLQFSQFCEPDPSSGYTLDDNARALVAMLMYFRLYKKNKALHLASIYLNFIEYCQQDDGLFYNYVNYGRQFSPQNKEVNLEDSNGRAIWALGYLLSDTDGLPEKMKVKAENCLKKAVQADIGFKSPRAIGFALKGIYYYHQANPDIILTKTAETLADELLRIYHITSDQTWQWFEDYLTYANPILSEALMYAWLITKNKTYKEIGEITFDFLLSHYFMKGQIKVISNDGWFDKRNKRSFHGEQPVEVAYTIFCLDLFYKLTHKKKFADQLKVAFSWFLGNNHLKQIMYNPANGASYDGLEKNNVNINQGAESGLCYFISRLMMEQYPFKVAKPNPALAKPSIKVL